MTRDCRVSGNNYASMPSVLRLLCSEHHQALQKWGLQGRGNLGNTRKYYRVKQDDNGKCAKLLLKVYSQDAKFTLK